MSVAPPIDVDGCKRFLATNNWPQGLQETMLHSFTLFPIRFFIVDDSGSMSIGDGHRMVSTRNSARMVNSTRWSELSDAVRFHAGLAAAAQSPVEFRFLNEHAPIIVHDQASLHVLNKKVEKSPGGGTPLCRHIREVITQVRAMEQTLRTNGHKAVIIIATDGESSDGDIAEAMRPLQQLPVWCVVRLCTDEDRIVDYWNNIDKQLELEMDVLDDLSGEGMEIYNAGNSWITYGEPLHRLREFGCPLREMDLIDQAKLTGEQMRAIVAAIFGSPPSEYPHPDVDWEAFESYVKGLNSKAGKVFNPRKNAMKPWINEANLRKQFSPNGKCVIM